MLDDQERSWIYQRAFVPEHIPEYVEAISGAEPFLHRSYIYFLAKKHLIFNGYPLESDSDPPGQVYERLCRRIQPSTAAVVVSDPWLSADKYEQQTTDTYYRLDVPLAVMNAPVAYMLKRARKELNVSRGVFGREHKKIINAFLARHKFDRRQKYIFKHIGRYLKAGRHAVLFEARRENKLAAFNIVDLGAADYAFYLFSFRAAKIHVPGASDLLFFEMVNLANSEGKKAINLGLGVNPGIRYFKEKWGGVPFLNYCSVQIDNREVDIGRLARKL